MITISWVFFLILRDLGLTLGFLFFLLTLYIVKKIDLNDNDNSNDDDVIIWWEWLYMCMYTCIIVCIASSIHRYVMMSFPGQILVFKGQLQANLKLTFKLITREI